jgi:hypothetical protein
MSGFARVGCAIVAALLLAGTGVTMAGCGGGAGPGSGGLILASFTQGGQDNVPLNRILEFVFSAAVHPDSVFVLDPQGKQRSTGAIQIREGTAFGLTAEGTFEVSGATVTFKPRLPGLCGLADAGLRPGTRYRVTIAGFPEAFSVTGLGGQPLDRTSTYEFTTRPDTDPAVLEDQIPIASPVVTATSPSDGDAAVDVKLDDPSTPTVYEGNEVVITLSENLHPCSVNQDTVLVHEYARGAMGTFVAAPNGNFTGFNPPTDQVAGDPADWGSGTSLATPQRIRAAITLEQDFDGTRIVIRPDFTAWPDNALVLVELTFEIEDFGGQPLAPTVFAFTTENLPPQLGSRRLKFDGDVAFDVDQTTAEVNTSRSVSRIQGFLLFAGDGDNGPLMGVPTLPNVPAGCTIPRQANDGIKDNFDPVADTTLDTGASINTCPNATDASTAVIWEFATFRIRSGVTVRIIGVNPAILLVLGDVVIESGARLFVRGDGAGGSPQGRGGNGNNGVSGSPAAAIGGTGVAGGGKGGNSAIWNSQNYGQDGTAGFGSPEYNTVGGLGAGQGNVSATRSSFTAGGQSGAGGGGGHAAVGGTGGANAGNATFVAAVRGAGGGIYPTMGANGLTVDELGQPSAGSGGGGAGYIKIYNYSFYSNTGGAGGAGGGFVDLTSSGDIRIFGTVDAAGSRGGNGASGFYSGSGGGGGGSGGGLRFLTPNDINLTNATITAAGGASGSGVLATGGGGGSPSNGGVGGNGRLVLEDGDSSITGIASANLSPAEGTPGFVRQEFNAGRFQGGGLTPEGLTDLIFVGPNNPTYSPPVQGDFAEPPEGEPGFGSPGAAIPAVTARGLGAVGIIIEVRGYPILPDGDPDLLSPTAFYTVGYFTDSLVPDLPTWNAAPWPAFDPVVGPRPADNAGDGFGHPALIGKPFLQFRFRFYLPLGVGPFDEGPFINDWVVRFSYNQ